MELLASCTGQHQIDRQACALYCGLWFKVSCAVLDRLAQDGLPGHLQSVVDAVCELQPRREGLGVHELRLRVVGEGVPDDVPRPHCLDEALSFLLRRALQAHAAWAVQVQRDQVRLRHPNVGDFAGRVDGSREVNREVPIDHVVIVSDFGDAVKADVQMVGRNHMDLPSVCHWP